MVFSGLAIVVNVLVVVPPLPSASVPVTVTVYFVFQASVLAGFQTLPSLSRVPSTSLPAGSVTVTEVLSGSSLVYFTSVIATTSVSSALGETTATVLSVGAGDGDSPGAALLPGSAPPCHDDGLSSPPQAEVSRRLPTISATAAMRRGRLILLVFMVPSRRRLVPALNTASRMPGHQSQNRAVVAITTAICPIRDDVTAGLFTCASLASEEPPVRDLHSHVHFITFTAFTALLAVRCP
jgi:hypothetical protein